MSELTHEALFAEREREEQAKALEAVRAMTWGPIVRVLDKQSVAYSSRPGEGQISAVFTTNELWGLEMVVAALRSMVGQR
jgi:hypothetical protein